MKAVLSAVLALCSLGAALSAQELGTRVRELEAASNPMGARSLLERAMREEPDNAAYLIEHAGFLDRHGDEQARDAYAKVLEVLPASEGETRASVARRLVILDLLAGDNVSAEEHLEEYRKTDGERLKDAAIPQPAPGQSADQYIDIPGPLGSFSRMIAISPDADPETILPAIARNVVTNGYQASASYEGLQPTEYLKLVNRYLSQARELEKLSNESKAIRIDTCESPTTAELLRVLGYRMRGSCGGEVILETVNATRAFLTIDSGFPLAELEQALRTSRPFLYSYEPSRVPILYGPDYWLSEKDKKRNEEPIDAFLGDPALCRLYLGLS
ncbi:MAG: hypothetical protein GY953_43745, partial [bacterium]|nr:hypothetical protein [bacterium]